MPATADQHRWEDVVFQDRHRDYGAYTLRRSYTKHVLVGALATFVLLVLVLASPYLAKLLREPTALVSVTEVHAVRYTDLAPPPPVQNIPPPPRIHIPPPVKTVIKFVPPKVTDKEIVEMEKMPTVEEIKQNDIGAETIEGTGEVIFEEPVAEATGDSGEEEDDVIFTVLEQPAEFAGGIEALKKFLQENMVYPSNARRMGVEGSVYVTFVVDKTGAISDIQVMKGISSECDKEAIRVVGIMPNWKPGKQSGHAVSSRFVLPLKFTMGR
jgi:periplasmic protein TonB